MNSCLNDLLDGDFGKNFFYFHILYFILLLRPDFIRFVDFTNIAASNTTNDGVKIRSHIEYLIQTYACAHFVVKTDEKCSLNGGF